MGPRFQRGHCLWLELRHLIIWTNSSNQWPVTHTLSKQIQVKPPNIDRGIIPHQTDAQIRYILGISTSGSLDATNDINKDTASKQSDNWDIWCTFLTHSGITEKLLRGIPQEHKIITMSLFSESVWRNSLVEKRNKHFSTKMSNPPYQMYLHPSGRTFRAART